VTQSLRLCGVGSLDGVPPRDRPTISVAMTTCQAGVFLRPQLESIASQTLPPDELIVFDDASTDGTWEVLSDFASRAPFVCHLTQQPHNVGLYRNIQEATAAVAGTVTVLADQDDFWEAEKLASVAQAFDDADVTLWFSDADLIDDAGRPLGRRSWDAVGLSPTAAHALDSDTGLRRLLHGTTVTGATLAVRSDILGLAMPFPAELQGNDHLFLHDGWLTVLAALHGRVVADPRSLTRYRQHPRQVTNMSMAPRSHGSAELGSSDRRAHGTRSARRHDLLIEHARVGLVAERLLAAPALVPVAEKVAYLHDLQHFLDIRTLPRTARRRRLHVGRQLFTGAYSRHARGVRTALLDLL